MAKGSFRAGQLPARPSSRSPLGALAAHRAHADDPRAGFDAGLELEAAHGRFIVVEADAASADAALNLQTTDERLVMVDGDDDETRFGIGFDFHFSATFLFGLLAC